MEKTEQQLRVTLLAAVYLLQSPAPHLPWLRLSLSVSRMASISIDNLGAGRHEEHQHPRPLRFGHRLPFFHRLFSQILQ